MRRRLSYMQHDRIDNTQNGKKGAEANTSEQGAQRLNSTFCYIKTRKVRNGTARVDDYAGHVPEGDGL